jgi:hypothetical protein
MMNPSGAAERSISFEDSEPVTFHFATESVERVCSFSEFNVDSAEFISH